MSFGGSFYMLQNNEEDFDELGTIGYIGDNYLNYPN